MKCVWVGGGGGGGGVCVGGGRGGGGPNYDRTTIIILGQCVVLFERQIFLKRFYTFFF